MNDKQRVAEKAVECVNNDMIIGLGTGSTADYFIQALAKKQTEQGIKIKAVASSWVSQIKAQALGLSMLSLDQITNIDLYVDGADEVSPDCCLLKGQGADLVREKLLAQASHQFIVLVDNSKLVDCIGQRFPIPIEVMPAAWQMVKYQLEQHGGKGDLRRQAGKDAFIISSHGSLILDMSFPPELTTEQLNTLLNATPGIVEQGIFYNLATTILIGNDGTIEERKA